MNTRPLVARGSFLAGLLTPTALCCSNAYVYNGVEGWCTPSSFREILADSVALADAGQLEAMFFFVRLPSTFFHLPTQFSLRAVL